MREMHWHPNNDEWQYYQEGNGCITVFASQGKARTFDYQAGDVRYVPFASESKCDECIAEVEKSNC
jgi:oxalate decarboxylase